MTDRITTPDVSAPTISRDRAIAVLFGDRTGFAVFLGVVLMLSVFWRVGFYITDTYAVANTVVNVAEGNFEIRRLEYSLTLGSQPGLYRNGTAVFGRNYAAAVLSVPFYWFLQAVSAAFELRVVLAGGWSLLAAGFAAQVGQLLDRQWISFWGTITALGAFVVNLSLASPLDPHWNGLLALQSSSLLMAGVVAVALYRLGVEFYGRRVGIGAGILASLGLPIAFWATIPKRHVFSAALVAVVLVSFARSRQSGRLGSRASAYAAVGLLSWLHAAEGLIVLAILLPIDFVTAPSNDRRAIATIAVVFVLALMPFVVTNVAVTGSPLESPRMSSSLGDAGEIGPDGSISIEPDGPEAPESPDETTTESPEDGTTGTPIESEPTAPTDPSDPDGESPLSTVIELVSVLFAIIGAAAQAVPQRLGDLWALVVDGISIVVDDPSRVYHVFARSGEMPGVNYANNEWEAIELSVVESAPVLGILAVVPVIQAKRLLDGWRPSVRRLLVGLRTTPRYQTDLLALGIGAAFTLLYLTRLPVHAQITVRYLVPVMPVALYGVLRIGAINRGLTEFWRSFCKAYTSVTVGAVVSLVVLFVWIEPAVGEAMQFHALLNLAIAGSAAVLVGMAAFLDRNRLAAIGTGIVGGIGTALFVLAGLRYFTYGEYLFPLSDWLSRIIIFI